ncbi:MAG TPA: class I SAM-dependent methyltransferase [Polyangia bacterium]|jgi:Cephalosporin hydroxylase.|nr:class I SAM-dependent methyltransferase [Polyangia bacterium]
MRTPSGIPIAAILAASLTVSCKQSASCPQLGELTKAAGSRTDKGVSRHNYTEVYERFLFQWKDDPVRLLEIGIEKGGSLEMWYDYFPKASIFGIDIEDKASMQNARTRTFIADQSKRDQLQKAIDSFSGDFDVLLDDGGHSMEQQQVSLGFLFRFVKPGGYYILEDIHTSLPQRYSGYGVEPDGANSTLAMIERYVRGVPPRFESKYMLPEEKQYLNEQVEFADLNFRNNSLHSIMCIFKKKQRQ